MSCPLFIADPRLTRAPSSVTGGPRSRPRPKDTRETEGHLWEARARSRVGEVTFWRSIRFWAAQVMAAIWLWWGGGHDFFAAHRSGTPSVFTAWCLDVLLLVSTFPCHFQAIHLERTTGLSLPSVGRCWKHVDIKEVVKIQPKLMPSLEVWQQLRPAPVGDSS